MTSEIKTLSTASRAAYAPPRNVVFAVIRYFARNTQEIEKQLAKSGLSVNDLRRAAILELANPKYTNPDRDTIKVVIDLLIKPGAKISWTRDSVSGVLGNLVGTAKRDFQRFVNNADFASLSRSLHRPLPASLAPLLLLERYIGANNERSPAPDLIKHADWQALRPKEREAAELDLLGFNRNEIAKIMDVSNRVVTNYLLNFRNGCNLEQSDVDRVKKENYTKNIAKAHLVRDRLINFIFDRTKLQTSPHLRAYTDKKLFRDLRRLAQYLVGRSGGFSKASYEKLKLMVAGSSITEIAAETGVTATTVTRDLAGARTAIRKAFARFVAQKNLPQGINPYLWALLDHQEQKLLRLFIAGKTNDEIARQLGSTVKASKIPDLLRIAREKVGLERDVLLTRRDDYRLAEPNQEFLQARFLNLVFGNNVPQVPDSLMPQKDYESFLYTKLRVFVDQAQFKHQQAFEMFLKGLDSGAVARRAGDGTAKLHSSFAEYIKKLRRSADKLIAAQVEPHSKTINLKPKQRQSLILDHLYTSSTKYSLAAQGLSSVVSKQVVKITTSIVSVLSKKGAISQLTPHFFKGLTIADIAKFYGYPEESAGAKIENDLGIIRDHVTDYLKSDLPSLIDPGKWISLDDREKIVVKGFAHGKTYQDLFRENGSVFARLHDIHAVMSRALGDLGIDRGDLNSLRFSVVSSSNARLLSQQRVLTRIFGSDIPEAPRGWDQKDFEQELYDATFQQLTKAKSAYKGEFEDYLRGLQPKEIAEKNRVKEWKKIQTGIFILKAYIKRQLAKQMY